MRKKDFKYLQTTDRQSQKMVILLYLSLAILFGALCSIQLKQAQDRSHRIGHSLSELLGDEMSGFSAEAGYSREYIRAYSSVAWAGVFGAAALVLVVTGACHFDTIRRNGRILQELREARSNAYIEHFSAS